MLAGIDDDRIRAEVRAAVLAIVEDEPNLLTAAEKLQISDEVLHEVFGLGPLEPLLRDREPSPTFWSTGTGRCTSSGRGCWN